MNKEEIIDYTLRTRVKELREENKKLFREIKNKEELSEIYGVDTEAEKIKENNIRINELLNLVQFIR